ncbi:TPA: hypothetical protein N2G15_003886 [Salmonella enterica]|nr:hypothetical protein [Salmonella enterica subsp. indica serovar 11:b:e,n,x]HBC0143062.1 hypothetical protein [Salmonella enterica subsp. indica serovar 11:b:e,n,x]HBC0164063.1 hypothetical protein [Salmonella enterica subsp. indica]HCL5298785.1 hypothetical protein [Salmonella enterica]
MKNRKFIFFACLLLILIAWGGAKLHYLFTHGELGGKPLYANLQAISERAEFMPPKTSNEKIEPVFIKNAFEYSFTKYDVLGIPTGDILTPYFFVITNTHSDDNFSSPRYIYSVASNGDFRLSCGYLDGLLKKERIDTIVSEFLKSKCILP